MILFHDISCRYTYASLAACARNGYCEPLSRYFVPEAGAWYSVGIHPWHIPATITPVVRNEMNVLASLAGHPQVLAIGEAGLDKLADAPMAVQMEVFEYQARLSVELGKPLVIHLVKAMSESAEVETADKAGQPLDYSWFSRETGSGGGVPEAWILSLFRGEISGRGAADNSCRPLVSGD